MATRSPVTQAYLGQKTAVRQAGMAATVHGTGSVVDAVLWKAVMANLATPWATVPWLVALAAHNIVQNGFVRHHFEKKVADIGRKGRQNLWETVVDRASSRRSRSERDSMDVQFDHMDKINQGWRHHLPWLGMDAVTLGSSVIGATILGGPLMGAGLGAAAAFSVWRGRRAMRRAESLDHEQHKAAVGMREATNPRALDLLRSLGRDDASRERVRVAAGREAAADDAATRPRHSVSRWATVAEVMFNTVVSGAAILSGNLLLAGASFLLARQAFSAASRLPLNMLEVGPALHAKRELDESFERPPAIVDRPDAVDLPKRLRQGVAFSNVRFGYGDGKCVFDDVSFEAPAGRVTTVVGPNAAGKSTLLELVQRNEKATLGTVAIDGVDVTAATITSITRLTTPTVPQQSYVLTGTLRENLLYAQPNAGDAELWRVCKITGLDEWMVRNAPDGGLDIDVSHDSLSGGTRQRVALARMLLRPPALALLDEPTSALDPQSRDAVLLKVMDELRRVGSTVILATHDVNAVRHSDRVVLLNDGVVTEHGAARDLLASDSRINDFFDRDPDRKNSRERPSKDEWLERPRWTEWTPTASMEDSGLGLERSLPLRIG